MNNGIPFDFDINDIVDKNKILLVRDWGIDLLDYDNSMISNKKIKNWISSDSNYAFAFKLFLGCGVIGGSMGLRFYNLLDRAPHDLDIVCNKNDNRIQKLIKEYSKYKNSSSLTDIEVLLHQTYDEKKYIENLNIHRIANLKIFDLSIDLFHDDNINYRSINGLMIQEPIDIIKWKLNIFNRTGREKDRIDLVYIFSQLKNMDILK